jgi:hypothetical protein
MSDKYKIRDTECKENKMTKELSSPIVPDEVVMNKIYVIRGMKVMLDNDLAELYEVETRVLNQAVSRNEDRFPSDFMFQLSEKEWENLKSQTVTSSWGGRRKLPSVFTEHGVLMLSSVLNSKKAIKVNIQIMRVFTRIRQMLTENTDLRLAVEKLERKSENHSKNIELVFKYLDELLGKKENSKPRKLIGFKPAKKKAK